VTAVDAPHGDLVIAGLLARGGLLVDELDRPRGAGDDLEVAVAVEVADAGLPRTAMTSGKSTDSDWAGVARETS